MNSRSQIEAQVRLFKTFKTPFLGFFAILLSLLAAPGPSAALPQSGGYAPLVSLFIEGIKNSILPSHWLLIVVSWEEVPEVYLAASVVLALLLSSPLISYQVMKFIVSVRGTRRTVYSLTVSASVLLATGALFGFLFFSRYVFLALASVYVFTGVFPPAIDAAFFYFFALKIIAAMAVAFTLPVYVYALVRYRAHPVH
jgi:Sec-independent protein secretion pathway component TatC